MGNFQNFQCKNVSAKSQGHLQSRESVENQNKWHHLIHYSFPKPVNDKLLVLLIGIDNAELHHSHVDLRVKNGGRGCAIGGDILVHLTETDCKNTISRYMCLVL